MAKRPTRAKPARPKPAKAKPELQASANAPAPRDSAREANSGFGDDQRTGLPLKRIGDAPPEGVGPNGNRARKQRRLLSRRLGAPRWN